MRMYRLGWWASMEGKLGMKDRFVDEIDVENMVYDGWRATKQEAKDRLLSIKRSDVNRSMDSLKTKMQYLREVESFNIS